MLHERLTVAGLAVMGAVAALVAGGTACSSGGASGQTAGAGGQAPADAATGGSGGGAGAGGGVGGGAGGAGGSGGSAAGVDGGLPAVPWFRPTTITSADADAAYEAWKTGYLEDCGGGLYRVRWSTPGLTVSEGIGYGMLLTVVHDERAIFDGLWQYYKNNRDPNGLMHWQRSGCEGAASGDNAATDADLDAAMALVMASRRWSTTPYQADARDLIGKIRTFEVASGAGGLALLKPGDVFGGATCINISYFAPAYYRVFAEITGDAIWTKLADDSYTLLERIANATTGLVPNWCDENGATTPTGPPGCMYYTNAEQYGSDAARTPWRIATDYAWWQTARAKSWLGKVTAWVKTVGIANIGSRHQLDGTATATTHSVVLVGAFADAAIAVDQATSDEFAREVVTMAPQPTYFPTTLRALYLLLPLGRFTPGP